MEFVDKLERWPACDFCNEVPSTMSVLNCGHFICEKFKYCFNIERNAHGCCVSGTYIVSCDLRSRMPAEKRVCCVNKDSGCDFVGRLGDLDEHLRESCAMYSVTCSKCGGTVVYKDMRNHYTTCTGKPGVFLRASSARSLLDNLGVACEKLEQAVASAGPNDRDALRDTVSLVREQFARIQGQLAQAAPWRIKACNIPRLGE